MPCWIALHTSITAESGGPVMTEGAAQRAVACMALGFTPRVAVVDEVVLMDVTGSLRLFGGLARLMQQLAQHVDIFFKSNKLESHTERAQAATSLIAIGRLRSARAKAGKPPRRTADLPMHTLSAARPHIDVLERIGCRTWGDLLNLPRDGTARRFGASVFEALDRARGQTPDNYDWLTLAEQFNEKIELDALVTHAPALMAGAERLLVQLQAWLLGRQSGLTALRLIWHLDKRRDVAPTGELEIRTANPAQDLRHVARLISERLAQQQLPAPVHSLRLQSLETQQLADSAAATGSLLLEARHPGSSAVELIERLSARLGDVNVLAWQPQADHRPEQMQRWASARNVMPVAIKSGAACARSDWPAAPKHLRKKAKKQRHWLDRPAARLGQPGQSSRAGRVGRVEALYPSWLLPEPMVLATFGNSPMYQGRLQRLAGPQRLEATGWAASRADRVPASLPSFQAELKAALLPASLSLPPGEGRGFTLGLTAHLRASGQCEDAPTESRQRSAKQGLSASRTASSPQQDAARQPPVSNASGQPPAIRDYFIYRSQQGALLWVYSERLQLVQAEQGTSRPARTWYLHGFFA